MRVSVPVLVIFLCYHAVSAIDESSADNNDDEQLYRVRRGGLSMLRLGRGLQMLRLGKRNIPMLRLGRSAGTAAIPDDLRFLLSNLLRDDRQVPLPRYGKSLPFEFWLENAIKSGEIDDLLENSGPYGYYDLDGNTQRQIRPAPRPGRLRRSAPSEGEQVDKRSPPYPRFGKELTKEEELANAISTAKEDNKRVPPLMRYGKESAEENSAEMDGSYEYDSDTVKRAMRMLRLGRGMRMLRLGKRPMDDGEEDYTEAEKRALRLLRLGKRPFKMLRLGRAQGDMEEEKRALRLLRLGKKSVDEKES